MPAITTAYAAKAISFAGKEIFKKLILDTYDYCKTYFGEKINILTSDKKIESILKFRTPKSA